MAPGVLVPIGPDDGVRQRGRRYVAIAAVDPDIDVVGDEDLERRPGRTTR
jgi:hypothetical protein